MRFFESVKVIVFLLYFFIEMVEEPGNGQEKRQRVIEYMQEALRLISDYMGLPAWLVSLLSREEFLGFLIDMMVRFFNSRGFFQKGQPETASIQTV